MKVVNSFEFLNRRGMIIYPKIAEAVAKSAITPTRFNY